MSSSEPESSGGLPGRRAVFRAPVTWCFAGAVIVVWLLPGREFGEHLRLALASRAQDGLAFSFESILTAHLVHVSGWHLFANLAAVLIAGGWLESRWGTPKFLAFYTFCVLGTTLACPFIASFAGIAGHRPELPAITFGASGLALACLTIVAVHSSRERLGSGALASFRPRHVLWALVFLGAAGLALQDAVGVIEWRQGEQVQRAWVLLGPQVIGSFLAVLFLRAEPGVERWFAQWRAARTEREHERLIAMRRRVDGLLEKISADGLGSLSTDEKVFLRHASRHYASAQSAGASKTSSGASARAGRTTPADPSSPRPGPRGEETER